MLTIICNKIKWHGCSVALSYSLQQKLSLTSTLSKCLNLCRLRIRIHEHSCSRSRKLTFLWSLHIVLSLSRWIITLNFWFVITFWEMTPSQFRSVSRETEVTKRLIGLHNLQVFCMELIWAELSFAMWCQCWYLPIPLTYADVILPSLLSNSHLLLLIPTWSLT